MKANNLTVSIPAPRCTKDCPFCVSKMTNEIQENKYLFERNLPKVKKMAELAQVSSILITSKNEPMDNIDDVLMVGKAFEEFPLELQTNGIKLHDPAWVRAIRKYMNIVAISICHPEEFITRKEVFENLKTYNLVTRVTILLSDRWRKETLSDIIVKCKDDNIKQLTFRIPAIPDRILPHSESQSNADWIRRHNKDYNNIIMNLPDWCTEKNFIRSLLFGADIYDIDGIGVTMMKYCIQENSNSEDIRSLIYQADGHLYTTWDKKGSILF